MKLKLVTKIILFSLSVLFIKIYQHNQIVKLNYVKQRLEIDRIFLNKQKNNLLVTLFKLKNPRRIKKIANNKFGLKNIRFSQIVTTTTFFSSNFKKPNVSSGSLNVSSGSLNVLGV